MEIPKEIRDRFKKEPELDPREQKKRSRIMYKKRKLDKDVKNYVKNRYRINSKDIDTIGRRHGFQCHDMGGSAERDR